MQVHLLKRTAIFVLLFVLSSSALAQTITASLGQKTISRNETVDLSLTMDSAANSRAQPDWSPLRQNFKILANSNRTMMNMVNGKTSMQTVWSVVLMPLRAGAIKIPPIRVGSLQSKPLTLNVTTAKAATAFIHPRRT